MVSWLKCRYVLQNTAKRYFTSSNFKPKLSNKEWEAVIGLEFHVQITSTSKLFSRTPLSVFAPPNSSVGWFDSAHPGTLPRLNKRCVEAAVMTALALNARVNPVSYFDRKHYFYPDLPAGYQITQERVPLAEYGELSFVVSTPDGDSSFSPYVHTAHLQRLHIEEDSGRSIHDRERNRVLVDLNRAGIGLMELVFTPCLSSAAEAVALTKRLAHLLGVLGVSSPKLSDSALRVDTNVSVKERGAAMPGVRTEIKNLNSTKFLQNAVEYEVARHISILNEGGVVVSETRGYDPDTEKTIKLRGKEGLQDYRFMPEPNLPPLHIYDSDNGRKPTSVVTPVESSTSVAAPVDASVLRESLPPLPCLHRNTLSLLLDDHQLNPLIIEGLVVERDALTCYKTTISHCLKEQQTAVLPYSTIAKLVLSSLQQLKEKNKTDCTMSPAFILELASLVDEGAVSITHAILTMVHLSGADGLKKTPLQVLNENSWLLVTDAKIIEDTAREVIKNNPELVVKYNRFSGNPKKKLRPLSKLTKEAVLALNNKVNEDKMQETISQLLEQTKQR